jgi:heme A synthase
MADKQMTTITDKGLKKQAFGLITGLSLQYLLGMYTNLFVQFPEHGNPGQYWEFAWKQLPVALHILLALGLLIGAIGLLIRSIKQKNKKWIITAAVGAITILAAGLSGARFIPSQEDILSFSMAVAFIIAILSYCWGIYTSSN